MPSNIITETPGKNSNVNVQPSCELSPSVIRSSSGSIPDSSIPTLYDSPMPICSPSLQHRLHLHQYHLPSILHQHLYPLLNRTNHNVEIRLSCQLFFWFHLNRVSSSVNQNKDNKAERCKRRGRGRQAYWLNQPVLNTYNRMQFGTETFTRDFNPK